MLEVCEVFQVTLLNMDTQLTTDLRTNTAFKIEIVPPRGAVLFIGRRTPVSLEASNTLD